MRVMQNERDNCISINHKICGKIVKYPKKISEYIWKLPEISEQIWKNAKLYTGLWIQIGTFSLTLMISWIPIQKYLIGFHELELLSWSGRQSPVFIPKTLICGSWGWSRTFYLHPSFPPFVSARRQAAPTSRTHWGSIYINLRIDSPQRVCHQLMSWSHHSNLSRLSGNLQIDLWTRFGTPSDGWQIPSRISQGICRSSLLPASSQYKSAANAAFFAFWFMEIWQQMLDHLYLL